MPSLTHPARFSPNFDDLSDSGLEDESHDSASSSGCWKNSGNQRMSFKSYCTYQNLKPHLQDMVQPSGSQSSEESEERSWQPTHIPRIIKPAHQIPQTDESERPLKEASAASFQALPHSETQNLESMPEPTSRRLKFRLSVGTSDQSTTQSVTPTTSVMVFHQPTGTTMQDLPMTETTSNMERYLRSRWLWQLPTGLEEESVSLDAHLRKHICPEPGCKKRFTSPGSLRAHFVVHTGATPFQCPHPGCGKEFNVMSNMRRHFRAHSKGRH